MTDLMTPADAAAAFGVTRKTLTKWADAGKLTVIRTLGNHRRFSRSEVERLLSPATDDDD